MGPLERIKVIDFTHAHGGSLATMHLSDFGAEVIKIEPPEGDMARKWTPVKNGGSGYFTYLNRGKKSVCADLKTAEGIDLIKKLVAEADIVCENFSDGVMERLGISYENLKKINPRIIYASLSGLGRSGPKKDIKTLDTQIQALSGMLERTGYPDRPPVRLGAQLGCQAGAVYLVMGITLALIYRENTGEGQRIDVSMVDALVSLIEATCVTYAITGSIYPRGGNSQYSISPYDTFSAIGGDIAVGVGTDAQWKKFLEGLGMLELAKDERYFTNEQRGLAYEKGLRNQLADWIKKMRASDVKKIMDERGIPSSIVYSVYDAMEFPQVKAREMLVKVNDKNMNNVIMPGTVVKLSSASGKVYEGAPELGQDTEKYKRKADQSLKAVKPVGKSSTAMLDKSMAYENSVPKILDGVIVVDFTQAYSGPFSTMQLADFGATVIKIERRETGDQSREWAPFKGGYSGYFASINRNKLGITLDLRTPEGLGVVKKLIAKAHILAENFKVGTMDKLGLGYEDVKKINPLIVYASLTGFGQTGPMSSLPAYDNVIQAITGMQQITGFPEDPGVKCGSSIGDCFTGITFTMGMLLAYWKALATGEGERVDVAMFDTLFSMLEYHILCKTVLGRENIRSGNNDKSLFVPYDLYKCADGWFSIGVCNEKQWKAFCNAAGLIELYDNPQFADNKARCDNYEAITPVITGWIKDKTKKELMDLFTAAKVPNSPLYDVIDIMEDEHSAARGMTVWIDDAGLGKYKAIANPIVLEKSPADYQNGAPLISQNTEMILEEIGYSDKQISDFRKRQIV